MLIVEVVIFMEKHSQNIDIVVKSTPWELIIFCQLKPQHFMLYVWYCGLISYHGLENYLLTVKGQNTYCT